jgi:acyl carrier protein
MSSLEQRVKSVLSQVLRVPIDRLSGDSSPDTIDQWDSVSHINLILALEEEFDVQFTAEETMEMQTLSLIDLTLESKGTPVD